MRKIRFISALSSFADKLAMVFITSSATVIKGAPADGTIDPETGVSIVVEAADGEKCDRCWTFITDAIADTDVEGNTGCLCPRCHKVVYGN